VAAPAPIPAFPNADGDGCGRDRPHYPPANLVEREVAGAPYFHNRYAATLLEAVNFYDHRFNIGCTVIPESP
jgi:hypothetical protein